MLKKLLQSLAHSAGCLGLRNIDRHIPQYLALEPNDDATDRDAPTGPACSLDSMPQQAVAAGNLHDHDTDGADASLIDQRRQLFLIDLLIGIQLGAGNRESPALEIILVEIRKCICHAIRSQDEVGIPVLRGRWRYQVELYRPMGQLGLPGYSVFFDRTPA